MYKNAGSNLMRYTEVHGAVLWKLLLIFPLNTYRKLQRIVKWFKHDPKYFFLHHRGVADKRAFLTYNSGQISS